MKKQMIKSIYLLNKCFINIIYINSNNGYTNIYYIFNYNRFYIK